MKNLKKAALLLIFVFSSGFFYSQAFGDGKNIVSVGFGLPSTPKIQDEYNQYSDKSAYVYHNFGTVVLKYEHGLQKYFGVGINLEYSGASATYNDSIYNPSTKKNVNYQENNTSNLFGFFGRLNAHYPIGESLDVFGGVGLGYTYDIENANNNEPGLISSTKSSEWNFDYQFTVGARYMIKPHFGLFAEFGRATTAAQVGITLGF